jgi:hypothetical protein
MFEQAFKNIENILCKEQGSSSVCAYIEQMFYLFPLKHVEK